MWSKSQPSIIEWTSKKLGDATLGVVPFCLDGWEALSTWGVDPSTDSYYAQITRNSSADEDGPDHWITADDAGRPISSSHDLGRIIGRLIVVDLHVVLAAMREPLSDFARHVSGLQISAPILSTIDEHDCGYCIEECVEDLEMSLAYHTDRCVYSAIDYAYEYSNNSDADYELRHLAAQLIHDAPCICRKVGG